MIGISLGGVGIWMLTTVDAPTGAFFLILAVFTVPTAFANVSFARRFGGDPRPFREQWVFRYQGWISALFTLGFVGIAIWGRQADADPTFSEYAALVFAGGFAFHSLFSVGLLWLEHQVKRRLRN